MLQLLVGQHGQGGSHTDTVVGTQRRTPCLHPFAIDISLDGVVLEVVFHIAVLLAHHIHVSLQDNRSSPFATRGSLFGNHYVARLVDLGCQILFPGKSQQELTNALLLFRRTGNLSNGIEIVPN